MELLIFLIFLILLTALVLAINYYRRLFTDGRDQYERGEILDVQGALWEEWQRLVQLDASSSYLNLAIGLFVGWILSYLGGMYTNHYESYLFHSALLPALWFLALPYLREQLEDWGEHVDFLARIARNDFPFFFALSLATMAQNFAVYGVYASIAFLWLLLNNLGILALLVYRFYRLDQETALVRSEGRGRERDDEEEDDEKQ